MLPPLTFHIIHWLDQKKGKQMILVIDDVKTFPFPEGTKVNYATTLEVGTFLLDLWEKKNPNEPLQELWLDHDLGGEDTIRPICLMLAERAFNGNPYPVDRIVICSLNPVGVDWIRSTLEPYYTIEICNTGSQVLDRF
jgi:hypothetical protein